MWAKIVAFFTMIFTFLASLFGINTNSAKVYSFKNLSYGSDSQQVVDLYLPKNGGNNIGLFVNIHGGAWVEGDKSGESANCESIAANFGYATMSMNYRLFKFPQGNETVASIAADPNSLDMEDMMNDITAALNTAVAKAAENGCNITNIAFTGYSAGGHLAMMYAYKYRSQAPANVAFCVSYVGPADLTDPNFWFNTPEGGLGDEFAQYLATRLCHTVVNAETFNNPETQAALRSVSPLYYADSAVPTVMLYGKKDLLVPFAGSERLDAKLTENGIRHNYIVYANSGHGLENQADIDAYGNDNYILLTQYCKDYFGY